MGDPVYNNSSSTKQQSIMKSIIIFTLLLATLAFIADAGYIKSSGRYCPASTTKFYDTIEDAKQACTRDKNCFGFQGDCNEGSGSYAFETCRKAEFSTSGSSCAWKKVGGSGSGSTSRSGSTSGFAKRQLDKHNYYRSMHGARDLKYSKSLENSAQIHANYLASTGEGLGKLASMGKAHSKNRNGVGENIFQSSSTGPNPSADDTTKSWYSEESDYDYQTGTSKNGYDIGHFTQVVWKGSTKFGIAKAYAKQKNGWYGVWVVAHYGPAGNVGGDYIANVQQPGWGK